MDTKPASTLSPQPAEHAQTTKHPQLFANRQSVLSKRGPFTSRVLWAVVVCALINVAAGLTNFGKLASNDFPFDTWTSCAINDFLQKPIAPDIVFLGSSLVLYPAGSVDADLLNAEIDGPRHHSILYFEKELSRKIGRRFTSFDFALPGEMPSDAYLVTNFLLQKKSPRIIVYGVGPRDFMDNLLPSPSATDPFRHLSRFGDYSSEIDKISPQWQERLQWELGRISFLYGQKDDIKNGFEKQFKKVTEIELANLPAVSFSLRHKLLPEYRPVEVGVNDCLFRQYVTRPRPAFVDNLVEYRKRYKKLKWETFLTQMEFLAQTIDVAKKRNIDFVLVSMPITDINRDLIGSTASIAYNKTLRALAQAKGIAFLDLDEARTYKLSDFEDTVHLHSGGGRKMLSAVAHFLASDNKLRTKLCSNSQFSNQTSNQYLNEALNQAWSQSSSQYWNEAWGQPQSCSRNQVATRKESFL